jgi:acetyl esterase/lipase
MLEKMLLAAIPIMGLSAGLAAQSPKHDEQFKSVPDLRFAEIDGKTLLLNLYLPIHSPNPPLVVSIHGGGWRSGNRKAFPPWLAQRGYAVASIDYRLSSTTVFPAQLFDCKGAIRWLRAHADNYGYDAKRIAVIGESAGGHLALLLGTTGDVKQLEGDVGGNLSQSSRVQAVVDFFGPADFLLRSKDQPQETEKPGGKVYQLLGKPVKGNEELAKLASPAFHVTKQDAPLLVFHGTADKTVLINQSRRICDAYKEMGLPVDFHVVEGAKHGGPEYDTPKCQDLIIKFLDRWLKVGKGPMAKEEPK